MNNELVLNRTIQLKIEINRKCAELFNDICMVEIKVYLKKTTVKQKAACTPSLKVFSLHF